MAIPVLPTYSAGEILTSADMNDVSTLGNYQGLFHIKTQTIGNAVSSVTVTGAFSSDFNNYKIIISNFAATAAVGTRLQLTNSVAATYANAGWIMQYGVATLTVETSTAQTSALIGHCTGTTKTSTVIEVQSPFLSQVSSFQGQTASAVYGDDRRAYDSSTNSSTGFTFSPASGTLTGGTIRVYGYRNSL